LPALNYPIIATGQHIYAACTINLVPCFLTFKGNIMATAKKGTATPKVAAATVAAAATPFAGLVAAVTAAPAAAPAAAPKVHNVNANGSILKAANHVAAFKGTKAVAAGGNTYQLTGLPYTPAAGHVNGTQWACVTAAIQANGGNAVTVAQVAQQFTAAGLAAGLAAGFMAYRAKGAKPNLQVVTA
jgi:hypothetical protein